MEGSRPVVRAQLRRPSGVPDGGQYAPDPRLEAEATLEYTVDDEVDALLADGSWEYPPAEFSEPEVLIRFWQRVPVSDTVLERFALNYEAQVRIWKQTQLGAWERANPRPEEKTGFGATKSRENIAAWAAARDVELQRLSKERVASIPDPFIRTCARVAQMARHSTYVGSGTEAEIVAVYDHPVVVGRYPQGRLQDFVNRWHLSELPAQAFKDPTRHVPDKLAEMLTEQRKSTASIEALHSEVYRMSAAQNMTETQYAQAAVKHEW